ncbi:hypothetical protein [Vibrio sp. 10N.261.51.F12]|uniref:hypothetical protein n=1 Tax=Vibrio sp. 10N.261.51.F12 TaxID=3229679 RepID=UPI00355375C2
MVTSEMPDENYYNVSILVLLYNKEVINSVTLNTIISSNVKFINCKLVIWNNGPSPLCHKDIKPFQDLGLMVVIKETLTNESLAKIYNKFIAMQFSHKYVFLDDDSTLNSVYLEETLLASKDDVTIPMIRFNGEIVGPLCNSGIIEHPQRISGQDKVTAIGTGIIVGSKVIGKISDKYDSVFDEKFYLYGVDTTFFFRTHNISQVEFNVIEGFEHSLSRLEKESEEKSYFRMKERTYAYALLIRYYKPLFVSCYFFFRTLLSTFVKILLFKRNSILLTDFLKAFIFGKHYRS